MMILLALTYVLMNCHKMKSEFCFVKVLKDTLFLKNNSHDNYNIWKFKKNLPKSVLVNIYINIIKVLVIFINQSKAKLLS